MGGLKEVKDRITSVKSTKKITSAMKMIASSKLRRAQQTINSFLPYSKKLEEILTNLLASDGSIDSVYAHERQVKRVAIVAFSSNSSLCGGFNANVIKEFLSTIKQYSQLVGMENIEIYPIGKKIKDFALKRGYAIEQDDSFQQMADKPSFTPVLELSKGLVQKFLDGDLDRIILINTHFKSMGIQVVLNSVYLPFDLHGAMQKAKESIKNVQVDYILEPVRQELLLQLIPKVLTSNLYAALLDSIASEHAARSLAMQIATDNADDLVAELTIEYNKSRQAAITNELLDIIGGAAALGG